VLLIPVLQRLEVLQGPEKLPKREVLQGPEKKVVLWQPEVLLIPVLQKLVVLPDRS